MMLAYRGSITTIGSSEGFRLDKSLFKQHPEFRQRAKLDAQVIGAGALLVTVVDNGNDAGDSHEEDKMVGALGAEWLLHPHRQ